MGNDEAILKMITRIEQRLDRIEDHLTSFHTRSTKEDEDALFEEAKNLVIQSASASASLLQRRLSIGYARAARIIDQLEQKGIVGRAIGVNPREVLVKNDSKS